MPNACPGCGHPVARELGAGELELEIRSVTAEADHIGLHRDSCRGIASAAGTPTEQACWIPCSLHSPLYVETSILQVRIRKFRRDPSAQGGVRLGKLLE